MIRPRITATVMWKVKPKVSWRTPMSTTMGELVAMPNVPPKDSQGQKGDAPGQAGDKAAHHRADDEDEQVREFP